VRVRNVLPSSGLCLQSHYSATDLHATICFCCLFNDVSNSDYIASNDWVTVSGELERLWQEVMVAWFNVLPLDLPWENGESHENRSQESQCFGRDSNQAPVSFLGMLSLRWLNENGQGRSFGWAVSKARKTELQTVVSRKLAGTVLSPGFYQCCARSCCVSRDKTQGDAITSRAFGTTTWLAPSSCCSSHGVQIFVYLMFRSLETLATPPTCAVGRTQL
jgi:hypothetical protein